MPTRIKIEKHGTCLDLATLFCGVCLANQLLPMLIMTKGHAFAAVSLTHGAKQWDDYRKEYAFFEEGPLKDVQTLSTI